MKTKHTHKPIITAWVHTLGDKKPPKQEAWCGRCGSLVEPKREEIRKHLGL